MSTTNERYDVIFVRRHGEVIERAGVAAENVGKAEATRVAAQFCHRTEAEEGAVIVLHGTDTPVPGSEWWH